VSTFVSKWVNAPRVAQVAQVALVSLALTGQAGAASYTTRGGDSLPSIARKQGVTVQQLAAANHLAPNQTLRIGQKLQLVNGNRAYAARSSVRQNQSGNGRVTAVAYRFVGIPYRLGGTGRGGIDCSAFTQASLRQMGYSIPRTARAQYGSGYHVSRGNLRAGDLLFFNTMGRGVSHAGLYLGNGMFANANSYKGRVAVESLSNSYWSSRFIGARRVMG
jgi:peptidoglycan DL-endopeptidase LytE